MILINKKGNRILIQGIKVFIALFLLVQGMVVPLNAEQLGLMPIPVLENIEVDSQVTFDSATELYTYSYSVSNPAANTGEIWLIKIDITRPRNTIFLSGDGLTLPIGPTTKTFDEEIESYSSFATLNPVPMVPVGQRVPVGWNGGIGISGFSGFSSKSKNDRIFPGNTQSGFEIISRGLPAIRDADILPKWLLVVESFEEVTKEEEQRAREIKQEIRFKTKTIGPTAPPESSKKIVEMIQGYIDESVTLGWLMDSTLADSLRDKLNVALQFIEVGDLQQAITAVDDFINLVDQASSSQITSEAHGLLFYNGDYLKYVLISDIPPVIILDLSPIKATLPIGETHTITATLTEDGEPLEGFYIFVDVISGPNAGLTLFLEDALTDVNGQGIVSYTSAEVGKDILVARVEEILGRGPKNNRVMFARAWEKEISVVPAVGISFETQALILAQAGGSGIEPLAESEPIEVIWSGGPDLLIDLFFPPLIKAKGGDQITITEITGNSGNTPASESITRYFLSEDSIIDPATDRYIGERVVPPLDPETISEGGSSSFVLPNDLPEGTYYMGACADADETVVELDEANNCEINKLTIVLPLEAPENQPPMAEKEQVVNGLLLYADGSKRFKKAIKEINESLDPKFWIDELHLDDRHGHRVFSEERHAVKELMYLLKGIPPDGKCGGVSLIELEYTGSGTIDVEVYLKKILLDTFTVLNGDTILVEATEETGGKLHPEIRLVTNGNEVAKIHTSCSKPIDIGDIHGDFVIADLDKLPGKDSKDEKNQVSSEALAYAQEAIDILVKVDRILAETLINETDGVTAVNPDRQEKVDRELAKAYKELAEGDAERDAGKPDKAIQRYRKAWKHASHAAKEATR